MLDDATRRRYLEALGVQIWVPRKPSAPPTSDARGLVAATYSAKVASLTQSDTRSVQPESGSTQVEVPSGEYPADEAEVVESGSAGAYAEPSAQPGDDWRSLEAEVAECRACVLHRTRTQTVFGVGNRQASWMLIGEAPGASEDQQGEPFVGPAGRLLTEMLRAIGLRREEVFIANILKCRPPNNRDPEPEEVKACEGFLERQVALIGPRVILAVGRIAAQSLLKTDASIGALRGKVHYYRDIPVIVIYHPAYLLRSLLEKRKAWEDLQFAMAVYKRAPSERE